MGLLAWLGDKLDEGTLDAFEGMLDTTARRAELDACFSSAFQNSIHELLRRLLPARGLNPSTHLFHVRMFLDQLSSEKLDDAANRVSRIARHFGTAGMAVEALAAGIVAGWFKAAAMRYRKSNQVAGAATKLKGSYDAFLTKLFLSSKTERKPGCPKEVE